MNLKIGIRFVGEHLLQIVNYVKVFITECSHRANLVKHNTDIKHKTRYVIGRLKTGITNIKKIM